MNYKSLSFAVCDRYQTWGAEAIIAGTIVPYPKLSREEILINFDNVSKELAESSERIAQFLYKTLSEHIDNVSVKVKFEFINNYSFWSVYIDGKLKIHTCKKTVLVKYINVLIKEHK